ncbi:MAG: DeoR/GlpR family DNA-binding transcription regulator [Clostridia bacterium]|nr:DeoR/GlpR family DNA-binding transcription regulator [Clostridia bacterium]
MSGDAAIKYKDLLEYLQRHGKAKVSELTRALFLSESTVRRALHALDEQGKLHRFHGGAVSVDPGARAFIRQRQVSHSAEKNAIGRLGASFVQEGMTLLLLGGTTVHAICPYLKGKRLTVITSSLPVINDLAWEEQMTVILLGGVLNPPEMEVHGGLTQLTLERLRADLMFTGTSGMHPTHGVMTDDPNGVAAYNTCMHISDQVFVLADHTKFENHWGTTLMCELTDISCLVTDDRISEPARAYYEARVPRLLIAPCEG